jgi:hypothetical protein
MHSDGNNKISKKKKTTSIHITQYKSRHLSFRLFALALGVLSCLVVEWFSTGILAPRLHACTLAGVRPAVRAAHCFRAQRTDRLGQVMRSIARIRLFIHVPGKIQASKT